MSRDRARYDEALREVLISNQQVAVAQVLESAREWLKSKIRTLENYKSTEASTPEWPGLRNGGHQTT